MDLTKIDKWVINGQEIKILKINNQVYWQKSEPTEITPFCITNVDRVPASVKLTNNGGATGINLQYSTDNVAYQDWADIYNTELSIPAGEKLFFKGTNNSFGGKSSFKITSKVSLSGDITTLLVPEGGLLDLTGRDYTFNSLFRYNEKIVDAKYLILPSTTLCPHCYQDFFAGCNGLIYSPQILPATELADFCYYEFFDGNSSLTTTPKIMAENLKENSFNYLFYNCSKIKQIELPNLKSWNKDWAFNWLSGTTGGNVIAPNLVAGDGAEQIPIYDNSGLPLGWGLNGVKPKVEIPKYFWIKQKNSNDRQLNLTNVVANNIQLEYTNDDGATWQDAVFPMTLELNKKVGFRSKVNLPSFSGNGNSTFELPWADYEIGGDLAYLYQKPADGVEPDRHYPRGCFSSLFKNYEYLKKVDNLLISLDAELYAYGYMFFKDRSNNGTLSFVQIQTVGEKKVWNKQLFTNWLSTERKVTGTFVKPTGLEIPIGVSGVPEGWTIIDN